MHTSVQIVSQQLIDRAMQNDKLERISFCGNDEVLGLQVKLNNAYGWKVTTLTEIPDRGATAGSRGTRKRAVAEESTVVQRRAATYTRSSWTVPKVRGLPTCVQQSPWL